MKIDVQEIIPLLNQTIESLFANKKTNQKAICHRGWYLSNRKLFSHSEVLRWYQLSATERRERNKNCPPDFPLDHDKEDAKTTTENTPPVISNEDNKGLGKNTKDMEVSRNDEDLDALRNDDDGNLATHAMKLPIQSNLTTLTSNKGKKNNAINDRTTAFRNKYSNESTVVMLTNDRKKVELENTDDEKIFDSKTSKTMMAEGIVDGCLVTPIKNPPGVANNVTPTTYEEKENSNKNTKNEKEQEGEGSDTSNTVLELSFEMNLNFGLGSELLHLILQHTHQ